MLLDIISQYNPTAAQDQNLCTLTNMFMEEQQTTRLSQYPYSFTNDPPKGEYKYVLYPTFGLTLFGDTGQPNVRTLHEHNGVVYGVAGNQFGSFASDGTWTQLGSNLNTSSGFAKMKVITGGIDTNNQMVIIDGTNGYSYNIGTNTATFPVADTNFPQDATDIEALDDTIFLLKPDSMTYQVSNISDTLTYDALNFASKTRKADRIVGLASLNTEIWLIGSKTAEVWTDTGDSTFNWQRRPDIGLEQGAVNKNTMCVVAGTLMYLAKSRTGGYGITQIDNYTPRNVATKPIMSLINSFSTVDDAFAYGYSKNGHEFYEITFPTANKTLMFDCSNFSWSQRQSNINGVYGRFRGSCHAFGYGKSLIGDSQTGKVYYQDSTNNTENGTAIQRQFISSHVYLGGIIFTVNYLQIDVQTNVGSNKTFLVEMSNDHGNTWVSIGTYTVPTDGGEIIRIPSLGAASVFTFRVTATDNYKFCLLGFQADIAQGVW